MRNQTEKAQETANQIAANPNTTLLPKQEQDTGCCSCFFSLFSKEPSDQFNGGMTNEQLIRVAGMM